MTEKNDQQLRKIYIKIYIMFIEKYRVQKMKIIEQILQL